jgi:small nuclear ribonucleoprotein (snRNP)-like protein
MYTNIFLQKCTNIPVKNKEIGTTGSTVHKSIFIRDMHMCVF